MYMNKIFALLKDKVRNVDFCRILHKQYVSTESVPSALKSDKPGRRHRDDNLKRNIVS